MPHFSNLDIDEWNRKELTALIFDGKIIDAVQQLIKVKNFNDTSMDQASVEKFRVDDGLDISMNYKQAHITFRLFLDIIVPKEYCSALDSKAGLDKNKLSWKQLVTLRILYIIFEELNIIIKNYVDVKQNYIIWTTSYDGSVAKERHVM